MSDEMFAQLEEVRDSAGKSATIDRLVDSLRESKEYHRLFDALLMKQKFGMGLPLVRPTSFDDVPDDKREAFEKSYIEAAREVGQLFLADNQIGQAWLYYRTIREPEPVAKAVEAYQPNTDQSEELDEILNIALYEGANPVKGLEIMLQTHGTCNTVTALDQKMPELDLEQRQRAACLLVRDVYADLAACLKREVGDRIAGVTPPESIHELIAGRDWLFENGNYHIDVSHLNAVVRFSRALTPDHPELAMALELAEYGSHLDPQLQYGTDPPFDEFYTGHVHYFRMLLDQKTDEALAYFRGKLESVEVEENQERQLVAYVLVDLLSRVNRLDDALDVAAEYLTDIEEASGFSFADLCRQAGRLDTLQQVARKKGDLVRYAAALLDQTGESES